MQEVYESTLRKHEVFKQRGYDVKVQWECDWDAEVKTNRELEQFLSTFEMVEPLQHRDAFFGDRTNAVQLHHTIAPEEKKTTLTSLGSAKPANTLWGIQPSSSTQEIKTSIVTSEWPKSMFFLP